MPGISKTNQVKDLLSRSLLASNYNHRVIQDEVDSSCLHPEFAYYLAIIFADLQSHESLRHMAGLVLKKALDIGLQKDMFDSQVLESVKNNVSSVIPDEEKSIRSTAANLIATIVRVKGLKSCIATLKSSISALESKESSFYLLDGVITIIMNICEDNIDDMLESSALESILNALLWHTSNEKLVFKVLKTINIILEGLTAHIYAAFVPSVYAKYIEVLSILTNTKQQNYEIKLEIVYGFNLVGQNYTSDDHQFYKDIIQFMYTCLTAENEESQIRLIACDFFTNFADQEKPHIKSFLKQILSESDLISKILEAMVYNEDELALLGTEAENSEELADRPEDIKPRFQVHRKRLRGNDDVNEDMQDYASWWTLRKAAAESMSRMSSKFPEIVFSKLMPLLEVYLSSNWTKIESSILALGAVANACISQVRLFLPKLIPFVIKMTYYNSDEYGYLIRQISIWCLSRFVLFVVSSSSKTELDQIINALLNSLKDKNKRVQAAGCSALAESVEALGQNLSEQQISNILNILPKVFISYAKKGLANNLFALIDTITTTFENVNTSHVDPAILALPLLEVANSLQIESDLLFSILACLNAIVYSCKQNCASFVGQLYEKSIQIIETTIEMMKTAQSTGISLEEVSREALLSAYEVLTTIAEIFGDKFVLSSELLQYTYILLEDTNHDVLFALFGFIGEIVSNSGNSLSPEFTKKSYKIMSSMIYPVNDSFPDLNVNAIWASTQFGLRYAKEFPNLFEDLNILTAIIIKDESLPQQVLQNCAFSLARSALVQPAHLEKYLDECFFPICALLSESEDNAEKYEAIKGLVKASLGYLKPLTYCFAHFCHLVLGVIDNLDNETIMAISELKQEMKQNKIWQYGVQQVTEKDINVFERAFTAKS